TSLHEHTNHPMARVWDVADGHELRRFTAFSDGVSDAVFAQQGRSLITTTFDGNTTVWDWRQGRAIARLLTQKTMMRLQGLRVSADGEGLLAYEDPFPMCVCVHIPGDTAFVWRLPGSDAGERY